MEFLRLIPAWIQWVYKLFRSPTKHFYPRIPTKVTRNKENTQHTESQESEDPIEEPFEFDEDYELYMRANPYVGATEVGMYVGPVCKPEEESAALFHETLNTFLNHFWYTDPIKTASLTQTDVGHPICRPVGPVRNLRSFVPLMAFIVLVYLIHRITIRLKLRYPRKSRAILEPDNIPQDDEFHDCLSDYTDKYISVVWRSSISYSQDSDSTGPESSDSSGPWSDSASDTESDSSLVGTPIAISGSWSDLSIGLDLNTTLIGYELDSDDQGVIEVPLLNGLTEADDPIGCIPDLVSVNSDPDSPNASNVPTGKESVTTLIEERLVDGRKEEDDADIPLVNEPTRADDPIGRVPDIAIVDPIEYNQDSDHTTSEASDTSFPDYIILQKEGIVELWNKHTQTVAPIRNTQDSDPETSDDAGPWSDDPKVVGASWLKQLTAKLMEKLTRIGGFSQDSDPYSSDTSQPLPDVPIESGENSQANKDSDYTDPESSPSGPRSYDDLDSVSESDPDKILMGDSEETLIAEKQVSDSEATLIGKEFNISCRPKVEVPLPDGHTEAYNPFAYMNATTHDLRTVPPTSASAAFSLDYASRFGWKPKEEAPSTSNQARKRPIRLKIPKTSSFKFPYLPKRRKSAESDSDWETEEVVEICGNRIKRAYPKKVSVSQSFPQVEGPTISFTSGSESDYKY